MEEIKTPALEKGVGVWDIESGELNKEGLFMLLKSRAYYKGVDDEAKWGRGVGGWLELLYAIGVITKRR